MSKNDKNANEPPSLFDNLDLFSQASTAPAGEAPHETKKNDGSKPVTAKAASAKPQIGRAHV